LGESQRTEGCIDRESPSLNVTRRPQAHLRRAEGEMGEVEGEAEVTEQWRVMFVADSYRLVHHVPLLGS
jgi:hypothetical protein